MPLVDLTRRGGVALLTLDNPPANAYSHEMHRELDAAILQCRFDEAVHVLVLTGAGEKFFCAGADIAMLARVTPEWKYNFCLHANETLNRLEQTPKLVIAALNGHCVGGGLEIALACDLRWARAGGGKLGLPEVSLGVLPGTGGTARLTRVLGRSRALELMVKGENVDFERGRELGLVHEVLPATAFMDTVLSRAEQFCPPHKAAQAVGLIKRSVVSGGEMGFHEHLALERELQQRLFTGADAAEGFAAFEAKRAPRFQGR
ncbi:MAG TPA: enoyl-CoA hydratase/isomerase family protein [Planctomycetota bacterium]|nr:enoyl-CoA hydratase/isomerase family protein [Planctomycetota bacterium]